MFSHFNTKEKEYFNKGHDLLYTTFYYFFCVQWSDKGQWETVEITGNPPSPRTCHSMASVGSKFYVFGGGLSGPDPVSDTTVHVFNVGEICQLVIEIIRHTSMHFVLTKQ